MTAAALVEIELKDPFVQGSLTVLRHYDAPTYEHSLRVAKLCAQLALANRLSAEKTKTLVQAALMHDLGKIKIPHSITHKPEALTDSEKQVVRQHPRFGFSTMQELGLEDVSRVIVAHHEYNVDSYPRKNERPDHPEINQLAQMLAAADIYDALTRRRHYRQSITPEEVKTIMRRDFKGNQDYTEQLFELDQPD